MNHVTINSDFCSMDGTRQNKYGRQILKDLSEVFQKDPRHFFGTALVTTTEVNVTPDLSLARVYLSVLPTNQAKEVFEKLEERKSEIRKLLGNKIGKRIRKIPELAFFHDNTQEKAFKIDSLIDSLNIPPAPDED